MSPPFLIEAQHLSRSFRTTEAVRGIDLAIPRGTIFGLLGPNGAGKTTTIRMLSGQIEPTSGTATVAGCDIVRDRAALKTRIGVVFEDQNLYERLSGRQNLAFSCWLYGLPAQRIDAVLDLVDLRARGKDSVRDYSNGMRQRLMIARALLHRPQVLFLDEPSRGLDPLAARAVRQTIATMRDEGVTILLTTHLMEEADQLSQQVAFIVKGQIVAMDTPRNLKLAHSERILDVTLAPDRGADSLQEATLKIDDPADQARLQQWLAAGQVRAAHTREATLEEVFLSIAGVRPA